MLDKYSVKCATQTILDVRVRLFLGASIHFHHAINRFASHVLQDCCGHTNRIYLLK